jgi:hypothetical protein
MKKSYKMPNMEHRFKLQAIGEETGMNWVGDFLYRRPTLQERALIDVMRARLNGDLRTVDVDTQAYNEAISHLRFTLKEYPDWWKDADFGASLYDGNLLIEIYNKCLEFEAEWRKKVFGGEGDRVESGNENQISTDFTEQ